MSQKKAGKNSNNNDYQLWQQHNNPIVLDSNTIMDQKLEYLHYNPIESGFITQAEAWQYSKCSSLRGRKKRFN